MAVVGATYLERGRPVTVVAQWRSGRDAGPRGPRNVLIRRADGELVVRPFRGLRRVPAESPVERPGLGPTGRHWRERRSAAAAGGHAR